MKKQIILILSFLLTAMCLTGCNQERIITEEKINKMAQIANNVASQKDYETPEGYKVSYPDETNKNRIMITDTTEFEEGNLEIIFDVSEKETKPVGINIPDQPKILYYISMIVAVFILYGVTYFFEKLLSKIEDKIEAKRQLKKEQK